jgi:hypothetical protein
MRNFFHYYRQYIYLEKPSSVNDVRPGAFYRLYIYKYDDSGITETYNEAKTPILLIIGKNRTKDMIYALKINNLPLRNFLKLYDDIQNQKYTKRLIEAIEKDDETLLDSDYTRGAKAILIDKSGKSFYNKSVKTNRVLKKYDTFRTYKTPNMRRIKELYFDVNKLKNRLGFKDFDPTAENE